MKHNNYCDGGESCTGEHSETRVLPYGGGGNLILCLAHYNREIAWRKERNRSLSPDAQFDLPAWNTLKVYPEA